MQALIDACQDATFPASIAVVIANKTDAYGLTRAKEAGIKTHTIRHLDYPDRETFDTALHEAIVSYGVEFVCLAGFMRLLTAGFTDKWRGKMLNIHPSLLPSFKGTKTHEQAIAAKVKIHGCTVHHVIAEMDAGEIIIQAAVPVLADDTPATLGNRVLKAEHVIYPLALRKVLTGETAPTNTETTLIAV